MAVLRAPWLLAACLALATGGPGWAAPTPDIPPRNAGQEQHSRTDLYGDLLPPGALARLGTVRWRSGASLWLVQFMPDGRSIISAAEDDDRVTVSLWDRATGKPLRRFGGRQRSTTHFTLSPDTRVLASAGNDHEIILWDVPTGKEVRRLPGHGTQYAAAFSPDGKTLAAAGSDGHVIRLWNVATGAEVRQFKRHRDEVMGVAFSPDGKTLASGSFDKSLRLWDTASGKQLRRVTAAVGSRFALAFSPDGRTLVWSNERDHTVRLADPATGQEVRQLKAEHPCQCVAFSPDGKLLAGGTRSARGPIHLWDVATGKEIYRLTGHLYGACALAFSADGKTLVSGENEIRTWDVATGKELHPPRGHTGSVRAAFSPDGRFVATAGLDGTVRLWDPATGRQLPRFGRGHTGGATRVIFAPDGKALFSAGWDKTIRMWDVSTGWEIRCLRGHRESIVSLACSPDGKVLASGSLDQTLRLWDVASGKALPRIKAPEAYVLSLAFSPDGKRLAAAVRLLPRQNYVALLWDVATGRQLRQWQAPGRMLGPVAFAPDGRHLAAADWVSQNVVFLDLAGNKDRRPVIGWGQGDFAFSPDGRTVAVAQEGEAVVLWEVATGQARRRFDGHDGEAWSLAFSPDGKRLVSGGRDSTALVWDVTGGAGAGPARPGLSPRELEDLWTRLGNADGAKAYNAVWLLAASPRQSLPVLKKRLRPVEEADLQRVARLVADLDSKRFAVRENAAHELDRLGESAGPALRKVLDGRPAPEVRRRVEQLLKQLSPPVSSAALLRGLRAIEVLEHIGTAEARQVLKDLTKGMLATRLTEEAKAALDRLASRSTDRR